MLVEAFSWKRALVVWVVATVLGCIILLRMVQPFRIWLSDRYTARGDAYLVAQDFSKAGMEYGKAVSHNSHNTLAAQRQELAKFGPTDIAKLEAFYKSRGTYEVVQKLDKGKGPFSSPKAALEVGYSFYQKGEFVYAQYPIEIAVQMDPKYPEAWHYLSLTYRELAKIDSSFSQKADTAQATRDSLTPKYILQQVEKSP